MPWKREPLERKYVHNGPEPAVRRVPNSGEQVRLLVNFFQQTRSYFHLNLGACAVLCPSTQAGRTVATDLTSHALPATFMTGQELDLKQPGIKVFTLQSAKGLEFPSWPWPAFSKAVGIPPCRPPAREKSAENC